MNDEMRTHVAKTIFVAVALVMCVLAGCQRGPTETPEDTAALEAAIGQYLHEKGFGMKVASFEEINVKEDAAYAVCRMQEAEGLYGLKVAWRFEFRREDNVWRVVTHATK